MSTVLTSKLPVNNTAFGPSSQVFGGSRSAMMYQRPFASSPTASDAAGAAGFGLGAGAGGPSMTIDPVRAAVGHLLSKAYSLPCSTAAHSFANLVQPTSRFQLALDALLPILDQNSSDLAQRILVSFILYSLYAPHPITINPFKSVLLMTFVKERDKAVSVADGGGVASNDSFVWVLWKILKGDGNDIGPYTPTTLARSPLPPKLRATNLLLDDELYHTDIDDYSYNTTTTAGTSANETKETQDSARYITREEDAENDKIARAMQLLLIARERVLTLAEQRTVLPMMMQLATSQIITPYDLPPIIISNPTVAHPLLVALITSGTKANVEEDMQTLPSLYQYLEALLSLPPSLTTFDLMGSLLRDRTPLAKGLSTVGDLVKDEVLGVFVHECILWLENAEKDEKEGLISDDRFSKGLQNLCRFYHSLIKLGILNPSLDADSAEMMHFSLRNSRFEEANSLYRALSMGGRAVF